MPTLLKKFIKIILILSIFIVMGVIRLAMVFLPFKTLANFFLTDKKLNRSIDNKKLYQAMVVGKNVTFVATFTPWESKCLAQSFTCRFFLRILNIPNILYIGVSNDDTKKLISHAWVSVNSIVIVGGNESPVKYKVMSYYVDL